MSNDYEPKYPYGSVEYYREYFSDIIADCATGNTEADDQSIINILTGFEMAVVSWMKYHERSVDEYRKLHRLFLRGGHTDDDI